MKHLYFCLALVVLATVSACTPTQNDPNESRIDELMKKMTTEEKVGQMNLISDTGFDLMADAIVKGNVGSVINSVDADYNNRLQKLAVEKSRLGIPLLIGRDVIHGFNTVFPIPLGQASTFDPDLVELGARVAAREATTSGVRWTFSPMLDIARDPRWGRVAEGSGEDTYLTSQMGSAMVRGYQGGQTGDDWMAACIKHFVGYGAAEGGRDYNSTYIPERQLRNVYLPPFKACVEQGAMSLMTSFNDNDGVPSTGNKFITNQVLFGEWGFMGMTVTDWDSAGEMIAHGFAADLKDAARLGVEANVDMEMMSFAYIVYVKELIDEGRLSQKQLDDCVRRILRLKFRLGLFDNPYTDTTRCATECYSAKNLEVARRCAAESAILLQNNNNCLPLEGVKSLLLTGPMADADHDQLGTWSMDGDREHTVTLLDALKNEPNIRLVYEPALLSSRDRNTADFARVAAAARSVDAVVVCVGEESILSGEAHSLSDLNLQGAQSQLIETVKKSGKPVVVVVMAGRPLTIERDLASCDAMLYSFHPGTMGGVALADLLFGREVPSGKCPMTFLRTVGQVPFYYNHNMTGRPAQGTETLLDDIPPMAGQTSLGCTSYYLDSGFGPLFPFGYGLSYTTFAYSNIELDKESYSKDDVIRVQFDLTNTGERDAVEVAQLYVRDLIGSVTRPVRELKRFSRVAVEAGQTVHCSFLLPVAELAFWNIDMDYVVESGDFNLWVGGDSSQGQPLLLKVD